MCLDPLTALMAAGTAVQAVGAVAKGNSEAAALQSRANQYEGESNLLHRQSTIEQMTSGYTQRRKVEQAGALDATQRGGYASAGLVTDTGSAADVGMDTARETALDISAIKYNSDLKASNLDLQGAQASVNAVNAREAASRAKMGGWLNAATAVTGAFMPKSPFTQLGLKF